MKTLIVYSSKSGNTKKLAEAILDTIPGEKSWRSVEEGGETTGFDLICIGFWFQAGKPDPKSAEFLQNTDSKTPVFLFATHGAANDSDHARNGMEQAQELAASSTILGCFNCQGEVSPELIAKVQKKNPPPPWISDAPQAEGHPNDQDVSQLSKSLKEAIDRM